MIDQPKVTVTFKRQECPDQDPDLSYLEQDYADVADPVERQKYLDQDIERRKDYARGHWYMLGIRAVATITVSRKGYSTLYTMESAGLWGVESDSGEDYLQSVYADECAALRADIEAIKFAEFKS